MKTLQKYNVILAERKRMKIMKIFKKNNVILSQ